MSDPDLTPNYLEGTHRIAMELSDWCNLAKLHAACPAHEQKGETTLHTHIIEDVVRYAGRVGYKGAFAWHMYNEPLADSRIVQLCQLVKDKCPTSMGSLIWTNGELLTAEMARALVNAGVYLFRVSLYTQQVAKRLRTIALDVPEANWAFSCYIQGFDKRIEQYEDTRRSDRAVPCYAPLVDISINFNGEVQLCCMDWQHTVTFGNLNLCSFEDFLKRRHQDMLAMQKDLVAGIRRHRVCKGCTLERPANPETLRGVSKLPPENLELDNINTTYDPRATV